MFFRWRSERKPVLPGMMDAERISETEQIDDLLLGGLKILQKKDAFRYGTDAVLLSEFARVPRGGRVLDIGTGTGILPILLSARSTAASFVAVEIQEEMASLAQRSVCLNGLQDRISVLPMDAMELPSRFPKRYFDCIVTNPPYKRAGSGLHNEKQGITAARHEIFCTLDGILRVSGEMLKVGGSFNMVCRPERLADALESMRKYRIEPKLLTMVYSSAEKPPVLFLVHGILFGGKNLEVTAPVFLGGGAGRLANYNEKNGEESAPVL